jgi:hypothetical protein
VLSFLRAARFEAIGLCVRAFDEASRKTSSTPQGALHPGHLPLVLLVVVAQEMEQPVQGKNSIFGGHRMAGIASLPPGDTRRNDHVTEKRGASGSPRIRRE